jgi:hypothetical protein
VSTICNYGVVSATTYQECGSQTFAPAVVQTEDVNNFIEAEITVKFELILEDAQLKLRHRNGPRSSP